MKATPDAPTAKVFSGAGPTPSGPVLSLGGIRTTALQQRGNVAPLILGQGWGGLDYTADVILKFRGCVVAALIGGGYRVAGAFGCAGNICAHLFE
jgi:hypothetical protein